MKKLVKDRWDIMEAFIQGKNVLDLGCVDHDSRNEMENDDWLHKKIVNASGTTLGVDYLEEDVKNLKSRGYNVIQGNVEDLNLDKKFDVITAGNIIEHLSNPGNFLNSVKNHLSPEGHFLLTTDCCYGLRSLKAIFLRDEVNPNDEHTMTFEENVLKQFLIRHDLEVVDFYFYNGPYKSKFKEWLINTLCKFRKSWAWQMLVVAKIKSNHES